MKSYVYLSYLFIAAEASISHYLKYYETIHADDVTHSIVKRGTPESPHPFNKIKEVSFSTHARDFRLILAPKREVLHSKFKAYEVDGAGNAKVVHTDYEDFYSGRVFGETDSHVSLHIDNNVMTGTIHLPDEVYHIEPSWRHLPHLDNRTMVTYRQSDVQFPQRHGQPHQSTCGYINEDENRHYVERRDTGNEFVPTKTKCSLLLVADHRFFQEMGGGDSKTTINYLISLIDRVHKIYNDTVWTDQQGEFKGMGFVIKKIVVHSEPTRVWGNEEHYNMENMNWDARKLLEVFSRNTDNKEVCLAHLFTHQTFKNKDSVVLGLAYIASPRKGSHGGVCTAGYTKDGFSLYLNSGLSSSSNFYGQRIITREADLVTTHELGHNWGSEHDPDIPECSPGASKGGSYLMYTYSVSGFDVNNKKFSPCSRRSIKQVLEKKSALCFSEPEDTFCGNLHVEGDEECDAGLLGTEDNDTCCDKDCRLRPQAKCSDKNSPCCQNCTFLPAGIKCREAQPSICQQESSCSGFAGECPESAPMPNETLCQEEGKCRGGECVPFCETLGSQSCMCDNITDSCKYCCRSGMNEKCAPVNDSKLVPDGTPCVQGFCKTGVCHKATQDVVERFWHIIDDININKVLQFLKDNMVGTIILLTGVIWIPASYVIGYIDKKRAKEAEDSDDEWYPEMRADYSGARKRMRVEFNEQI